MGTIRDWHMYKRTCIDTDGDRCTDIDRHRYGHTADIYRHIQRDIHSQRKETHTQTHTYTQTHRYIHTHML